MLKFKAFEASPVFEFPDPDTSHLHTGHTKAELISNIVNYRAQNKLDPLDRLDLVIDNYLCSLPCNTGKCEPTRLERGFLQFIKGGLSLVSKLYYGQKHMVSQDIADERSKTCKDCIFNEFPDRGNFVVWSDEIALHSTLGRRAKYHDELGNCMCCTCPLRAKVWYKGPFKLSKDEELCMQGANVKCWQLKMK